LKRFDDDTKSSLKGSHVWDALADNGRAVFPGRLSGEYWAAVLQERRRLENTWLRRRAGHGVAVLLKIYAHCIDGQADAANQRITDALGTEDAEPEPGGRRRRRQREGILNAAGQRPERPGSGREGAAS
jgi:hypothetical protein